VATKSNSEVKSIIPGGSAKMTGSLTLQEYPADTVRLSCPKCGRDGQLAEIPLPDLREEIAQCERRGLMHDACMVRYVDLVVRS
jgi:hypothetical protein